MKLKLDHFAWQVHSPAVWTHTHPWSCMHTIRQPTVCLASFKPVASEAQSSTRLQFPPTLFSPISLTPNFSLLWSDYRHVYPPCLHLPLSISLSVSVSLQVLVAFISFSETMLLVYLSYKVSYSRRTVGKPSVMFPDCDVDTCGMCEHPCNSRLRWGAFALFASLCLQQCSPVFQCCRLEKKPPMLY